MFIFNQCGVQIFMLVYVDDIVIVGSTAALVEGLIHFHTLSYQGSEPWIGSGVQFRGHDTYAAQICARLVASGKHGEL
jgi:hypothetical protein